MKPLRAALFLFVLSAGRASAQPTRGDVQPDRISFGTLYTGAVVEASFMIFEPGNDADIMLGVTVPDFVKVLNKATHAQQFGLGNDFVCGTVEITIDTTAAGELNGEMTVTLGQATANVPISAIVKPVRPELTRLLIAATPFDRYSTKDGKAFKAWTDLVNDVPLDVSYLLVTRGKPVLRDLDLSQFDGVVLAGDGIAFLRPVDLKNVRAFAEAGGRVLVAANAFYRGTVERANWVLTRYGLQIRDEEAAGGQAVTLGKGDLNPEVVKAGVGSLRFFRASPVAVADATKGRVLVNSVEVGEPEDGFVAIAQAGAGNVIALGESLWWNWLSESEANGTDNAKLLRWLLVAPKGAFAGKTELLADSTVATDDDTQEAWGHLKGRFAYDGDPPQPQQFDTRKAGAGEAFDESLSVDEHGGLANVVVVVVTKKVAVHPDYAATDDAVVRIRSNAFQFEPHVAKSRVSQTLEIQNADAQAHNFNLAPVADQPINVLLQSGSSFLHHFHRPQKLPTPVTDNIYPWMKGYVVVCDHPYAAVTNANGTFKIRNLPVGELEFAVWHERVGWLDARPEWKKGRFTQVIAPGNNDLGTVRVSEKLFGAQ